MFLKLHTTLLRRPWAVWLAVLITLFGTLAPTMSHALAQPRDGNGAWTEVCTSTGTRWVATPNVLSIETPDGPESAPSLVHCPFCLLLTDRVAPAPHALVHLFAVSGEAEVPTIRQVFLFFTHFAPTPPPRGPPAVS